MLQSVYYYAQSYFYGCTSIPKSNSLKPNFPTALKSKIHTRVKTRNLTKYQTAF